ncbi:MAG TPA: NUDIX hydrolase [Candidatus Saccharimonadales bacterium]|nr:NUDIX hydrolase [Candidatus Saccharimonadales bacterium]
MKTVPIAKVLLLDAAGSVLILRRSATHPTLAGHSDLPGGLIESGEEPGEALAREILEETGLTVAVADLTLAYAGTEAYEDESRVRLLYKCRLEQKKPAITLSWEHDQADWRPLSELPSIEETFHSFYHDALEYVQAHNLLED